jgi:DNA-binding MarR family transcriptional regulator
MNSISSEDVDAVRRRRRLNVAIKESLRELSIQLSLLNHHVGGHLDLKDVDLDCLDLIARHGPLSPSALARRAGLHPATMTGIIDRLERGGWVARDRDPSDRRAVLVRALRERNAELLRLYSGMNTSMDQICAGYGETELELLADFLRRTANAGRSATDELAGD